MDFNIRKIPHIIALLLLVFSIIVIFVFPIMSYFNALPSTQSEEYQEIVENINYLVEFFLLIFQLVFALFFFIIIPVLWYILVNSINVKEALKKMKLTLNNIDMAFLWGIVSCAIIYAMSFLFVFFMQQTGIEVSDLSNVPDLEAMFSPPVLLVLVAVMPIAEEIFFRGFLLDKIEGYAGSTVAIFATAVLFGIAHLSYGKIYPVFLIILMGILLAYIVVRTKNLYASIVAHITFNVFVIVLVFIGRALIGS